MSFRFLFSLCAASWCLAQAPEVEPQVVGRPVRDGQVTVLYLAPHYATAVRMPEPVNSVVVGDPKLFSAEHSEHEPHLVIVKPITVEPARSNMLITTTGGQQVSLLLISRGETDGKERLPVDFVMGYRPSGRFLIEPSELPSAIVPRTVRVAAANGPAAPVTQSNREASTVLDDLLDRQRKAPLPTLYGEKPRISKSGKERVKAGVGEVIDQGSEVAVLFSVVNPQDQAVQLMPPQVQLGGKKKGRWATAEQFPILDFLLSRRRIGPAERVDGVVVFRRPAFKQSTETLLLQIAESGAVDRPALAPIGFGISSSREEVNHGSR